MKVLFKKQGGRFLQPGSVGSSIQWHVRTVQDKRGYGKNPNALRTELSGEVHLTDCTKMIVWSAADEDCLTKLDEAITELIAAREALAKAVKAYDANPSEPDDE